MGFKGVYKKFNGCLKKVSKLFQGCFNGDSTELQVYLKEGVSNEFRGLTKFQEYFVSSVFQENLNIAMKFCFAIFFSHSLIAATQAEGGLVFRVPLSVVLVFVH